MRARSRESFVLDLDQTGVNEAGDFELILAFGVLYHLARPEEFLHSCGKTAKVLLLETAVCDRREPAVTWVSESGGWRGKDPAGRGRGGRPSPAWVEGPRGAAGAATVRDNS